MARFINKAFILLPEKPKIIQSTENAEVKKSENSIRYIIVKEILYLMCRSRFRKISDSLFFKFFVYTPSKDLTFDKYVYNINDKELSRPDTKFKYDKNDNIIKDNININSNNEIKTNRFSYVPNQNLTFGEYTYDKDNVLTKENNFKYSQQNGLEFTFILYFHIY
jgi:hypothetical protein